MMIVAFLCISLSTSDEAFDVSNRLSREVIACARSLGEGRDRVRSISGRIYAFSVTS